MNTKKSTVTSIVLLCAIQLATTATQAMKQEKHKEIGPQFHHIILDDEKQGSQNKQQQGPFGDSTTFVSLHRHRVEFWQKDSQTLQSQN